MHISIIGAGLSGACMAKALSNIAHLQVNVYEGSPSIRETGAAIGLGVNAHSALRMIDPALLDALFAAAGSGEGEGYMRHFVGQGPDAGKWIMDIATTFPKVAHVPRAQLLHNLWKHVPDSVLHLKKQLTRIERVDARYVVHFADGSSVTTDAVIGTDGIHSTVRRLVLAAHPNSIAPVWTGFWDAQRLVPLERAWQVLQTKQTYQKPDDVRTVCLAGNPGFLLFGQIPPAALAVCVTCGRADAGSSLQGEKSVTLTKEFLAPYLDGFGELGRNMTKLLLEGDEEPKAYFEWESGEAPFYNNDAMCVIGDAAHASTPWLGSGAAMAIEDAMLIGKLLAHTYEPRQIPAVFDIYNRLRRERTQKVVRASRQNGQLMCGASGLDLEVLKRLDAEVGAMDWIYEFDLDKHVETALSLLDEHKDQKVSPVCSK